MTLEELNKILPTNGASIPLDKRKVLWDIVSKYERCLEAGFANGVSSVVIANSTKGMLSTYDLPSARERVPNIADLCELTNTTNINWHTDTDYKIAFYELIEQGKTFDFIFIDTDHFFGDTLAGIVLADKLLEVGGTLVLDDIRWSPNRSSSMQNKRAQLSRITDKEWVFEGVMAAYKILLEDNKDYSCELKNGMAICQRSA